MYDIRLINALILIGILFAERCSSYTKLSKLYVRSSVSVSVKSTARLPLPVFLVIKYVVQCSTLAYRILPCRREAGGDGGGSQKRTPAGHNATAGVGFQFFL